MFSRENVEVEIIDLHLNFANQYLEYFPRNMFSFLKTNETKHFNIYFVSF